MAVGGRVGVSPVSCIERRTALASAPNEHGGLASRSPWTGQGIFSSSNHDKRKQPEETADTRRNSRDRGRDSEKGGGYLGYLEPYPRAMGGRGTSKDRAAGRTAQQQQKAGQSKKKKKKKTTREKKKIKVWIGALSAWGVGGLPVDWMDVRSVSCSKAKQKKRSPPRARQDKGWQIRRVAKGG